MMNAIAAQSLLTYTTAFEAAFASTNDPERTMKVATNDSLQVRSDTAAQLPLSVVVIKQRTDDDTEKETSISSSTRRARVSPMPTERLPPKKALTVSWKDQSDSEHTSNSDPIEHEIIKLDGDEKMRETTDSELLLKTKKRSPSPPHLDLKEYEHRMKRLQTSIGEACKIELKMLNKAKMVREKRMRMVEQLKHMKRKVQRAKILNAQWDNNASNSSETDVIPGEGKMSNDASASETENEGDQFVLPPVYREKSGRAHNKQSSSNYVDMTQ